MKAIVIYYSVSGSTRKIAQAIHKGMQGLVDQCDIVALRGAGGVPGMKIGRLLEYDLVGLGAPIWRSTMTPNMMDFINIVPTRERQFLYNNNFEKAFSPAEDQHYFFFITHGKSPGPAVERAWKAMKARGLTVIGWNDWYGNAQMAYAEIPWQTEGHPDDIALQEAEEFGRQMVERSRRISRGEVGLIPELPTGKEYLELYGPSFNPDTYAKWIKHHYGIKIDQGKCTRCGICEENCPMGAIDLDAAEPILPNCMYCTTCELVCPVGAVDINLAGVKQDRGSTPEEIYAKGQELHKIFEERQKGFRPDKRCRLHVNPKDLFTKGYVGDLPEHPRVVIPVQAWKETKKA
ncbi:MAG: Flavodoxin [Chloroflexi bacterium]|nr:Flavodoxin [Chloroflexota bacterium]